MAETFFISDTHWGHVNVLRYCMRPFKDVEEHDEKMIENWNEVVKQEDMVYHLGDVSFHPEKYMNRLNGHIYLILGNHDKNSNFFKDSRVFPYIYGLKRLETTKINDQVMVLCHYQMAVWDKCHFGAWHLFGHQHSSDLHGVGKSLNVGVDFHDYTPIHFDTVAEFMKARPDHPHFIPAEKRSSK